MEDPTGQAIGETCVFCVDVHIAVTYCVGVGSEHVLHGVKPVFDHFPVGQGIGEGGDGGGGGGEPKFGAVATASGVEVNVPNWVGGVPVGGVPVGGVPVGGVPVGGVPVGGGGGAGQSDPKLGHATLPKYTPKMIARIARQTHTTMAIITPVCIPKLRRVFFKDFGTW